MTILKIEDPRNLITASRLDVFSKIDLAETNIIQIYDVRDSSGNKWYEVPYLAQEMVFVDYAVSNQTDKDLVQFKDSVSNILKLIKTSRRFVTKVNADNTTTIVFGVVILLHLMKLLYQTSKM